MQTIIHFVVMLSSKNVAIEQLSGVEPNKKHGAVTPVKAVSGKQQFSCCYNDTEAKKSGLCMTQHAGKLYEGATHGGTNDPQFVNCPFCKETNEFKEAMADHERHTAEDKGLFSGIFDKQRASVQRREEGVVASTGEAKSSAKNPAPEVLLPTGK